MPSARPTGCSRGPHEAAASPSLAAPTLCWRRLATARRVTGHDGRVRADHPVIVRAIGEVQSATSLRLDAARPAGLRLALRAWAGARSPKTISR